jgi:protein-tyrosine phosphatase
MIDIHTHLLPRIDDGAESEEHSLHAIKNLVSQGMTTLVCTPHISTQFRNSTDTITQPLAHMRELIAAEEIECTLLSGAEYTSETLYETVKRDESPIVLDNEHAPKNGSVLVELPLMMKPPWFEQMIGTVGERGFGIVIAHPERHVNLPLYAPLFRKHPCLFAISASSLTGDHGKSIYTRANDLLTQYPSRCVVASDSHPSLNRIPDYLQLLPVLEKKHTQVLVRFWTEEHPAMILSGTAKSNNISSIIAQYYRHR